MTLQRKNFVDIYYRNIEAGIANEVDSVVFLPRFCFVVFNYHNTDELGFFSFVGINMY